MLYWNCRLIRTCCLVFTDENSEVFRSNVRLILLTCHFARVNSSKSSQVCHMKVYDSKYLRKCWQTNHLFFKKTWKTWWSYHDHGMNHGKHGYFSMIMPWIMTTMPRNMAVIMAWSLPCFAMIMARSWHCSYVFPTRACKYLSPSSQNCIPSNLKTFTRYLDLKRRWLSQSWRF